MEVFMQKVAKLKHLWYSKEFQLFIKKFRSRYIKGIFLIMQALKSLAAQTEDELQKKYDEVITKLSGKEIQYHGSSQDFGFSPFTLKRLCPSSITLRN